MTKWFTIVCLGDSLTVGYQSNFYSGISNGIPYTYHLENMTRTFIKTNSIDANVLIINEGINGDSTDGMIKRLPYILSKEKPDLLILWAGINDLSAGRNPLQVIHNLSKIVQLCKDANVSPVICSLSSVTGSNNFNRVIRKVNDLILRLCESERLIFVDIYGPLTTKEGSLDPANSNDGIHLSDRGYYRVSETVYESIKPILESLK